MGFHGEKYQGCSKKYQGLASKVSGFGRGSCFPFPVQKMVPEALDKFPSGGLYFLNRRFF